MDQPTHAGWLITTRRRAAAAVGLTALLFALSIRAEMHPSYTDSSWLFLNGIPHGWLTTAFDLVLYGFYCYVAFDFIRATKGRERLFIIGCFGFLLAPVKTLRPQWAEPVAFLEFFGTTLSLLAALSLLVRPEAAASAGPPSPPQS